MKCKTFTKVIALKDQGIGEVYSGSISELKNIKLMFLSLSYILKNESNSSAIVGEKCIIKKSQGHNMFSS